MRTLLLYLLALLAFPCQPAALARDGGEPVRLGTVLPSAGGGSFEKGVRLWADEVNARGGILGREVELVIADDHSDPAKTAEAYAWFAAGGAQLLLGPPDPRMAREALPALKRAGAPCVFPMADDTLWEQPGGVAFGVFPPASEWPAGFFEILSRQAPGHAAIIAVNHPDPSAALATAEKWARRYGVEPSPLLSLEPAGLPAAFEKLKAARVEAVAVWGSEQGCAAAAKALAKIQWQGRAAFVASSATLAALPARETEGLFTAAPWDIRLAQAFPEAGRFARAYRAAYGHDPDPAAAAAYAGCQVLEAAAAKARSLEHEPLRQALSGLETLTVAGRYGVAPSGMQLRQIPLTLQWQKGKREIVWPETMRTALPALAR